ncbi:hypothetical protein BOW53_07800 [Solemya pervernicosa gill symbiont]|uniref:EpsG family protein n=2 Tax=Gammaproteobacteria incertae sedis TaxID=118884 RepID=A0A1T2L5Q9_9GAMM|nr:EpsG family protein [Candidatus Reidiella endopervernicosa]OOZ40370.1 hypothetical protein BOW53_07800 [Solemya pervernicosa gill symbiont]QKQ25584.1 EpsG family protein [Candidatus Reidiella endopervernicosa]
MISFWLSFLFPVAGVFSPYRTGQELRIIAWFSVGLFLTILIGLRHEVGGDWVNYLRHYDITLGESFSEAVVTSDPAYASLNWLIGLFDGGIYSVNLVCAVIFVLGLIRLCQKQPLPWLALAVAAPYLVTVVAMGYTRQATALGIIMWALAGLREGKLIRYSILVVLACTFHKTAVIMFLPVILLSKRGKVIKAVAISALMLVTAGALLAEHYERLMRSYVDNPMVSEGGEIRVLMNVLPALLLIISWKRWQMVWDDSAAWVLIALMAIACLPLLSIASTVADRLALYLIPLQLVVYARTPLLINNMQMRTGFVLGVLVMHAAVLYVWLNYAGHAHLWVPYRNILFE